MIRVDIRPDRVTGSISPMVYGQMLEHAYWSVHLGLCAQMLDNGGFEVGEEGGGRNVADGWKVQSTWAGNRVQASVDNWRPFVAGTCQKLSIERYERGEVRLVQEGLCIRRGRTYRGFVHLRGNTRGEVHVGLSTLADRRHAVQRLGELKGEEWSCHGFCLEAREDCRNASFYISAVAEGTMWVDQAMLYPDDEARAWGPPGLRTDMVELYRGLKPAYLRWPGGTYLIWHRWKNGVLPLEQRANGSARRLAMGVVHPSEWDPGTFGTDAFLAVCRQLGAEPVINVRLRDGLEDTLDWMEYVNGSPDSPWGGVRARNGHAEPYNVRHWVIDNEPQHRSAEKGFSKDTYPMLAALWAKAMKERDPGAVVLVEGNHNLMRSGDAAGGGTVDTSFTLRVAERTRGVADYVCVHTYYEQPEHGPLQGMPYRIGRALESLKRSIDQGTGGRLKLAVTEWNPQCYTRTGGNMGQALEGAVMFHQFERLSASGVLAMASPCQVCVNVDRYRGFWLRSALVQITNRTAWVSPLYHVNRLYAQSFAPLLVESEVSGAPVLSSQAFESERFPGVDVLAARDEEGKRLVVKTVNYTPESEHELEYRIDGAATPTDVRLTEVSSPGLEDENSEHVSGLVLPRSSTLSASHGRFRYLLKANTVAVMEVRL